LEHEVGGFDELSHDGDDDELGRFASGGELVGEGFQGRVVAPGGDGGEVEQAPWPASAACDEAQALVLAGVRSKGATPSRLAAWPLRMEPSWGMRTTRVAATIGPMPVSVA
jgi:hypothetical protein